MGDGLLKVVTNASNVKDILKDLERLERYKPSWRRGGQPGGGGQGRRPHRWRAAEEECGDLDLSSRALIACKVGGCPSEGMICATGTGAKEKKPRT